MSVFLKAFDSLCEYLGLKPEHGRMENSFSLFAWNDAPERTSEDIVTKLRTLANLMDGAQPAVEPAAARETVQAAPTS